MAKTQQQRIVFGLKVRQLRQEQGWSFEELSRRTGISVSYLNEIEKGKKYPLPENLEKLASVFAVGQEFLTSLELTKKFAPLGDLLQSNFLNELPLELFGIELQQVVEIIARAPDRVNAFISAMLEIARNYSLREENFYHAALRAYQEMRMNYFEEIEQAADDFVKKHSLPTASAVPAATLTALLKSEFKYKIEESGLTKIKELQALRSVFIPKRRRLLLNGKLHERQRAFQLAKEIGFSALQLKERPMASNLLKINNFEEVLNNFKAAYFAVALLVNREEIVKDLHQIFAQTSWQPHLLTAMMTKFQASPEVLFQRFNVLSREFDLQRIFFMRVIHDLDRDSFDVDKELHLNRRHQPHASGLNEYYCRRWLVIDQLRQLADLQKVAPAAPGVSGIQRATFFDAGDEYLCLAVAKPGYPTPRRNVGITIGIQIDAETRRAIRFLDDPAIPQTVVNVTCERCSIADCAQRAAPPTVVQKREERRAMQEALRRLTGG